MSVHEAREQIVSIQQQEQINYVRMFVKSENVWPTSKQTDCFYTVIRALDLANSKLC